jgi:hypothetical protein
LGRSISRSEQQNQRSYQLVTGESKGLQRLSLNHFDKQLWSQQVSQESLGVNSLELDDARIGKLRIGQNPALN